MEIPHLHTKQRHAVVAVELDGHIRTQIRCSLHIGKGQEPKGADVDHIVDASTRGEVSDGVAAAQVLEDEQIITIPAGQLIVTCTAIKPVAQVIAFVVYTIDSSVFFTKLIIVLHPDTNGVCRVKFTEFQCTKLP